MKWRKPAKQVGILAYVYSNSCDSALRALRLLLPMTLAISVCGCFLPSDPLPPPRLGVKIGNTGQIEAAYRPCGDSSGRLTAARLYAAGGRVGRGDDELLWEIANRSASSPTNFTVGSQPDGFETIKAIVGVPIGDDLILESDTDSKKPGDIVAFELSDLRLDEYLLSGSMYLSVVEFHRLEHCD